MCKGVKELFFGCLPCDTRLVDPGDDFFGEDLVFLGDCIFISYIFSGESSHGFPYILRKDAFFNCLAQRKGTFGIIYYILYI